MPTASSDRDLMRFHVEALFTHDERGDLVRVNEPNGAPAPRFFLGRTVEGLVWRVRHDVDMELRNELARAIESEQSEPGVLDPPTASRSRYEEILGRSASVQRIWTGPAFRFPDRLPPSYDTILINEYNSQLLSPLLDAWLPDVSVCSPMCGVILEDRVVSVCCSVRRTGNGHEAGVETAPPFRGRGYAARATAAWAHAVRDIGRIPLYSTSWQNEASRAVARTLQLIQFGSDLHIG